MQKALLIRGPSETYLSQLESEFLEEVVTLVINEDECREVLNMNLPDCLHSEFRIFYTLNALDVVLSKDSSRTTNRAEVETTMLPPWLWKRSTYESIRPAVVGPIEPHAIPAGVFAGQIGRAHV